MDRWREVTPAQIAAAQLQIELAEEDGLPVDGNLRKLAQIRPAVLPLDQEKPVDSFRVDVDLRPTIARQTIDTGLTQRGDQSRPRSRVEPQRGQELPEHESLADRLKDVLTRLRKT